MSILISLSIHKFAELDGIPAIVCAGSLVKSLSKIFLMSFSLGNSPDIWKLAHASPIPSVSLNKNIKIK